MVAVVYRNGKLGVELSETLNQMIESKDIPIEMHEQVMQSFDKRVNELLKDNWCKDEERITNNKLQGRIENGVIDTYRNVDNNWTFDLEEATFRGQAFVSTVKTSKDQGKVVRNIHVVIIDQKQAELARPDTPPRVTAGAGAGAADGDSAPAMTADSWDDWEDDPSGQPPPPPPAGHVGVEQAQAQRQARAEEQAQAAAREQYTSANQTSLAMASGAGSSLQPAAAAAEEDEDLDDWEGVDDGDNPLDDTPANKKRKRAGGDKDAQDDFDYGDELNSDDDDDDDDDVRRATELAGVKQKAGAPVPNTVFAQFKKVKRMAGSKNKWNCELLAGIATIDGLDYAFTKCEAVFRLNR